MFDLVRNNQKVVQVVLALITLPFAFWGIDSYVRNTGPGDDLAKVGASKITRQEFDLAMREQQDRMRGALGAAYRPELLNTPEARKALLDSLINQRILGLQAQQARLVVTDDQLREVIASIPGLQEDGKFSMERYQRALQSQGKSQQGFEAEVRANLALQQIPLAVGQSAFPAKAEVDRWIAVLLEERQVSEHVLKRDAFAGGVKVADDAVQKYYDSHRAEFELPDQAQVEYVVLSQNDLASRVTVSDADIKAWYESHADRYQGSEERQASHILITVAKDAPESAVKAAKAKADEVLAKLKAAPKDFAKLAKEYSADPGSAEKGGDLGYFARGAMVKPFEDAVFSMKDGQVSDLVRSDFGFHIIKVTGIKGGGGKSLAQVKDQIAAELKAQGAAKQYGEAAEALTNLVYEQSDSLKPAADKLKLTVQRLPGWIARKQANAPAPFNTPRLLESLFSDDTVKNKRNTEAVEVAQNTLVSARIVEYRPAAQRPFAEVQDAIRKKLIGEETAKLAEKAGLDEIATLQKGGKGDAVNWSNGRTVSRVAPGNLAADAVKGVFSADPAKLPAYAGGRLADGSYVVYKISSVVAKAPAPGDQRAVELAQRYAAQRGQDQLGAYFQALRQRFPVAVNTNALAVKDR